jgi:PUA domain protein
MQQMPEKYRRHFLKDKEAKLLLSKVSERFGDSLRQILNFKGNVELVETEFAEIYLFNGKPILVKTGERIFPTLLFNEFLNSAPKFVVDMGAVSHICNGADVMAPGIVRFEGQFGKGDFVLIVDEKHGKSLAVGEALLGMEEAVKIKQGVVVRNVHFTGDRIWNFIKKL